MRPPLKSLFDVYEKRERPATSVKRTVGVTTGAFDGGGGSGGRSAHPPGRARVGGRGLGKGAPLAEGEPGGAERDRRRRHEETPRAAHCAGSRTSSAWFVGTFSSTWTIPLGHRISSFVTVSSFPRPKCTRTSEAPP